MPASTAPGRRERKRDATRRAIADAALQLFLERGFDQVSLSEVAEKADVANATLFNYFPNKASLVFDRENDFDERLATAIRRRTAGTSILDALRHHVLTTWVPLALDPELAARRKLINDTPALRAYSDQSWLGHADALAQVIADESGRRREDIGARYLARAVLSIPALSAEQDNVEAATRAIFDLIKEGCGTI